MRAQALLILLPALGLAGGCVSTPDRVDPDPQYQAAEPVEPLPAARPTGAIYQAQAEPARPMALWEDDRAKQVGDVVIIQLSERTNAQKSESLSTDRSASATVGVPTLFGGQGVFQEADVLETRIDGQTGFEGDGSSAQSASLTGSVAAVVSQVLPNGNLLVHGEKIIRLNAEEEYIRISGIVRPQDVSANNVVLSTRVANAQIDYGGNGEISNSSRPGWILKLLSSFFWPL